MKSRTLTRRVIIREYDFNKIKDQALGPFYDGYSLYDTVTFMPLDREGLEKLKIMELLKGKTGPLTEIDWDLKMPSLLLWQLRDYLYNERYTDWTVTTDDEGYLCVQARKNTPKSRIGWGVFEKTFTSRL